jgi:hypothetical protein
MYHARNLASKPRNSPELMFLRAHLLTPKLRHSGLVLVTRSYDALRTVGIEGKNGMKALQVGQVESLAL